MFDKEYRFVGKHAEMVKTLNAKYNNQNNQLFERYIDVYKFSPIVGFLFNRKSEVDKTIDSTAHIMGDAFLGERKNLKFIYDIVILLEYKNKLSINDRVDKVFKYFVTDKAKEDEEIFNKYVLGGVEILYEKLIQKSDDYLGNLYDFLEEFDNRYGNISTEDIINNS